MAKSRLKTWQKTALRAVSNQLARQEEQNLQMQERAEKKLCIKTVENYTSEELQQSHPTKIWIPFCSSEQEINQIIQNNNLFLHTDGALTFSEITHGFDGKGNAFIHAPFDQKKHNPAHHDTFIREAQETVMLQKTREVHPEKYLAYRAFFTAKNTLSNFTQSGFALADPSTQENAINNISNVLTTLFRGAPEKLAEYVANAGQENNLDIQIANQLKSTGIIALDASHNKAVIDSSFITDAAQLGVTKWEHTTQGSESRLYRNLTGTREKMAEDKAREATEERHTARVRRQNTLTVGNVLETLRGLLKLNLLPGSEIETIIGNTRTALATENNIGHPYSQVVNKYVGKADGHINPDDIKRIFSDHCLYPQAKLWADAAIKQTPESQMQLG